ncbi:MAG: pyridoxamine 5'-phosphate oxidase family protein [Alphaproteobacteria bacterium]|nr:pyridoxamine 5'-phosphate oxidase family protein [Alphaproteobacteria bacterium]MBU0793873.1 pyridoxamine 5'-phosphate oxidase family protein [Alphaproteobacteria bacterium]MBU0875108.1 pyridoxamine 5'-phosphate oxidase family protein [Alphaproteobacteria bacterium]MBU1768857.1 pyridoxamine 5'-phosphate oxidase family protein [Alphaproteobacteria bacterium]
MSHDIKDEFWKSLSASPILMVRRDGSNEHALPMHACLDEDLGPTYGGAVWFFTERDNRLAPGGSAMAQFMSKGHDVFACVSGQLVEETDSGLIDRFWSNPVASWFDGREDPKLLVLRMELNDIEIWTADLGIKGRLKLMTGSRIDPQEAGEHAQMNV